MVATPTNTAIVIEKEAHTLSEPETTWKNWLRQKYRHYTTAKYYRPKHKFLLGLYSLTHISTYALFIVAVILYTWWLAVAILAVKLLVQAIVWKKAMKKLDEQDLWPMFIVWDIWMLIYYVLFVPALWKRPAKNWN